MTLSIQVRKASIEDADLLAELGAKTFTDAFGDQNNPKDLQAYLAQTFTGNKIEEEFREPGSQFFIAYDGLEPVGYAKLRTIKIPSCVQDPSPIELERIYADQAYVGKGVGAALMRHTLEEGRAAGFKTIWLGVWKKNSKAISFYKKWGYLVVGEHEFVVGKDVQYDFIMARVL